jgi:toxin ParE1/3/4
MKIFVSNKAEADLLHLFSHLAQRNLIIAETIVGEFHEKLESLARSPFIGRERSSLGVGMRSVVVGMYVIFYVIERDHITVVRVLDGRRDIDAEFQR